MKPHFLLKTGAVSFLIVGRVIYGSDVISGDATNSFAHNTSISVEEKRKIAAEKYKIAEAKRQRMIQASEAQRKARQAVEDAKDHDASKEMIASK